MPKINYDPDPKGDSYLKFKGVNPPERIAHGVTEDELDKFVERGKHKCKWQREGNHIFCEAGGYKHGYFVHPVPKPVYRKENKE